MLFSEEVKKKSNHMIGWKSQKLSSHFLIFSAPTNMTFSLDHGAWMKTTQRKNPCSGHSPEAHILLPNSRKKFQRENSFIGLQHHETNQLSMCQSFVSIITLLIRDAPFGV
eukprot:Sdes_comp22961_c0_seq1m21312